MALVSVREVELTPEQRVRRRALLRRVDRLQFACEEWNLAHGGGAPADPDLVAWYRQLGGTARLRDASGADLVEALFQLAENLSPPLEWFAR